MTICNMSIEWGARAGMIAPDETTFAYLEGRPHAPSGAAWERALERLALATPPIPARPTTRTSSSTSRELAPQVTWGTNPGMVVPVTGAVPDPADFDDPDDRAAAERALAYMGLGPGSAIEEIRDRPRLHRLLHELADRGPARGRGDRRRPTGRPRRDGARRARLGAGAPAGRGGRSRPDLPRRRLRVAACGLLDVPRHEPRRAPARASAAPRPRTATSRGARASAAARTSSAPQMAAAAALHGHFVDVRSLEAERCRHEGASTVRRARGGPRPPRRRHRPDHPEAVPEADRAHGLRPVPRSSTGASTRTATSGPASSSTSRSSPVPGSCSPAATSAAGRRASTPPGRCRTTASTWSSRRRSATSSARTRPRSAWSRRAARRAGEAADGVGRPRPRLGADRRPRGATMSTPAGKVAAVRVRRVDAVPAPQRPRRHRAHAPARGRDHRLRGGPRHRMTQRRRPSG